jgi:disulfide bond formation protein DsbB
MIRSPPSAVITALVSATMLGVALGFEHIGGLKPCHLCMDQRYLLAAALLTAMAAGTFPGLISRFTAGAAAALVLSDSGYAAYQVAAEHHWVLASCAVTIGASDRPSGIVEHILGIPSGPCDVVAWQLAGISMAGWNALIAFPVGIWALCAAIFR